MQLEVRVLGKDLIAHDAGGVERGGQTAGERQYTAGVPSSAAAVNVSVSVCSVTWAVEGSAPLRMAP